MAIFSGALCRNILDRPLDRGEFGHGSRARHKLQQRTVLRHYKLSGWRRGLIFARISVREMGYVNIHRTEEDLQALMPVSQRLLVPGTSGSDTITRDHSH